jgi:hypothetical protein
MNTGEDGNVASIKGVRQGFSVTTGLKLSSDFRCQTLKKDGAQQKQ